jgi:transcriptional regulator with XRE-family HTH domain
MTPNRTYITKLVNERGWSDSELARHMGISRAEANRFMKGQRSGGKKLMSGLLRAFPNETVETLFILPSSSPIVNTIVFTKTKTIQTGGLVPVKNLNNTLVAKMDARNGVIEVAEHGYTTQFKVPAGTDIQVIHHLPPGKPST